MVAAEETPRSAQVRAIDRLATAPWWLILILLAGVILVFQFSTSATYQAVFARILAGLVLTVYITFVAYLAALIIGLLAGLGRVSKNTVIFTIATLYVQIIRGVQSLFKFFTGHLSS